VKQLKARAKSLDQARESFRRQAWRTAFSQLSAADQEAPLEPQDLQELAIAAHLCGREADSTEILSRAHHGFLKQGNKRAAARCAFWLGFIAMNNGESAQASGWLARSRRLLEAEGDCVEIGYLLLPDAFLSIFAGDTASAYERFAKATTIGDRFGDKDLMTIALNGQGRALIRGGDLKQGLTLLDEAMISVTSGEVSPIIAGAVYCSVIDSCHETFDLRRAQEWTTALGEWCDAQPELMPYGGHCMLQRAEILQLRGEWSAAMDEAERACERLSRPTLKPAVGAAYYRMAELHRLRGHFGAAEEAYRQSSRWERTPQPGLAQLRLVQGQVDTASAAIRRAADEVQEIGKRARVLDAYVEIALAAQDVSAARLAADELREIALRLGAPFLQASSAYALGAVLLAEGNVREALGTLRQSWNGWCELEAPYEAARVRTLIALACRNQCDEDAASLELAAAREAFQRLGAVPDLARVDALSNKKASADAGPLTGREVEVLRLVASGMTNREISNKLFISEKTVARHISNIFTKLDLSSRAAATAYAYQHRLV
jgi:DNA-binding NarL/FixJ family response regulator